MRNDAETPRQERRTAWDGWRERRSASRFMCDRRARSLAAFFSTAFQTSSMLPVHLSTFNEMRPQWKYLKLIFPHKLRLQYNQIHLSAAIWRVFFANNFCNVISSIGLSIQLFFLTKYLYRTCYFMWPILKRPIICNSELQKPWFYWKKTAGHGFVHMFLRQKSFFKTGCLTQNVHICGSTSVKMQL